ncbi:MAG: SNF2-related protein [Oscillospiraceae bacterium]|nr:SNF2-related protein [Oscillospiraceae bacterium]
MSDENHDGKGIQLKKPDCYDVQLRWNTVAKRISALIHKDRYLTPKEHDKYEELQRIKAETDPMPHIEYDAYKDYSAVKEAHGDDLVLYQVGDFFEMYGEDARNAADTLGIGLTTRVVSLVERVPMCGVPAHNLEHYVEQLRDKYDVTISSFDVEKQTRQVYSLPSIDHEAELATDAYEAEFGADGTRAFPGNALELGKQPDVSSLLTRYSPVVAAAINGDDAYRNACRNSDQENAMLEGEAAISRTVLASDNLELIRLYSDIPEFRSGLETEVLERTYQQLRPISQEDIDDALRAWNGDPASKRTVVQYMTDHAREKDTAAWLANAYGSPDAKALFITRTGTDEVMELSWAKVQRRVAQLIQADTFYTDRELDDFADIDAAAVRENLAEHGIVDGKVVDEAALNTAPIIQQAAEAAQQSKNYAYEYQLLSRLRSDCDYFLNAGGRNEKSLWAGDVYAQIAKMRELYDLLPEKPEWLTKDDIDRYAEDMRPKYQVIVYHHTENGYDEKLEYQTLQEAEKVAQGYVAGTMEPDGFAYDGAAVYNLQEKQYLRTFGSYTILEPTPVEPAAELDLTDSDLQDVLTGDGGLLDYQDKDTIGGYFRNGETNAEVAQQLAAMYDGTAETMTLLSGETADYYASVDGLEVHIQDKFHTQLSFGWDEITPILRAMYQQERDGFSKEPTSDLAQEVAEYEAGRLAYREQVIASLTPEQRRIVAAMETGGFPFRPTEQNPRYFGEAGEYPTVFDTWADAYAFIDSAELKDTPGLREKVQSVLHPEPPFPFSAGDTVYLEDGKAFVVEEVSDMHIQLRDPSLLYPIWRSESRESFERLMTRYPQPGQTIPPETKQPTQPETRAETVAVYPAEENHLPYDIVIQTLHTEPEHTPPAPQAENFHITDDALGVGGAKAKFRMNMEAINLLKELEFDSRQATTEEQAVLSRYVGWGGLADAFDETKQNWSNEFQELYTTLSPEEYAAARASTLNAHYTSPTVIKAIYEAVGSMGFETGNILEPSMGVGNFFGLLPDNMAGSKLYGVELDSLTGRIAKQLYPKANITVAGFETTDRKDFFDLAVGNVPFGQYSVNDRAYNKLGFSIHNYFFAKALDQVRPGGVVAFVTSRYTMDAKDSSARKYIAQRADLLGAIRLPNNAFKANAGTEVVSDIIFLQKRDRPLDLEPDWVHLDRNDGGYAINSYFTEHPEMVLGNSTVESTAHGMDYTVTPIEGLNLADQLHDAVKYIRGNYQEAELPDLGEEETTDSSIPADPDVKNYSYTVVDGSVYYRENSIMSHPNLSASAEDRIKGLVALRDCTHRLIDRQMDGYASDAAIRETQSELNDLYDSFSKKYGLINDRANRLAFSADSSYYLLCSLEVIDDDGNLERKADMFTKRTIKQHTAVTSVDTASEALAVSIGERACVDLPYMADLCGKSEDEIISDLTGVIFYDPKQEAWQTADEYLSGNVRQKLREAKRAAEHDPDYRINVAALEKAQPKDLDASEIEVRLGATWIDKAYIQQFMEETFDTPAYMRRNIQVNYVPYTAEWQITNKNSVGSNNIAAYTTYGTDRANAYRILEDSLNLRDIRIYDTIEDADGKEKRVLNSKETTLAAQKQQAIRDAFKDWIWRDPERRETLVRQYNEEMNSTRPREYDGSHITFSGINPEITLREHQKNAIAHVLYGGNTLLAHEVGAGKTFEMVAACMESKRLGLSQKSIFVVPNHLTEQWASEFLRLYPSANLLVTTKKDFETHNRKKFCSRIATGDYDAIIIGQSQFERIPISVERQEQLLYAQIDEITEGIAEVEASHGERFTVKQLERTRKGLEARLEKLQANGRKDDVITFEQLGVDRMFVDESDNYKNLFLYTKMRNVAGLSTSEAQKSSDMFSKCRYLDEVTGNRGVVFATGTPISNSMTEMYTIQRYLQYDRLKEMGMSHFDCWASRFGETTTALELAPEGTGYRARTRFAKFFNLPELMYLFREVADIKTAKQLNLPTPEVEYHTIAAKPTEIQQQMVKALSERASRVHSRSVDPSVDNMLKITSDGRKLGLDQRVINPDLPDEADTKVNRCVDNIAEYWRSGDADKLTQLVFCDISTPKAAPSKRAARASPGNLDNPELHALEDAVRLDEEDSSPFSIYDDIRQKLIGKGLPSEQIAFIHDANTDVRKKELFAKVRSGQVRVLIGSTAKMGAGTNVQDRLITLHDLDCPWRPRDLTQRKGRIERQGNKNKKVNVCRYVTEGTFDAYLWQTVEIKQKFISQIMSGENPVRSCEDVDATALSFAEIKALCAGDPRIKERMDLDVEVTKLKIMKADHQSKQYRMEDNLLKYYPQQIEQNQGFIAGFEADMQTLAKYPQPQDGFIGMTVRGDTLTDKENAGAALLDACKEVKNMEPVEIGSYRGFAMSVSFEPFENTYKLTLKGEMTHRVELGKDARGNLTRIDNALDKMPERLSAVRAQLENLYKQQAAAQAEVGKPFPQEDELKQKSARLVELDSELNMDNKNAPAKEDIVAKSAKPSLLAQLRQPLPPRNTEKNLKQRTEER